MEPSRNRQRYCVGRIQYGTDEWGVQLIERVRDTCPTGLGGIAAAPMLFLDVVTDFEHALRLNMLIGQPAVTEE